ncbi:MAG: serine/threonine-protein kinase [Thermoanaerobaculia bacterium]|nr:serine/threonine-protein kinase [Thermoanaerobaculia bacterium]
MKHQPNSLEQHAQAIFEAVVELPAGDRPDRLAQLCADDPALQNEVEALLAQDLAGDEELSAPGFGVAFHSADRDETGRAIGERLGPYRILRSLATGGMSQVFLAERDDDAFHLPVAVKVIRRGLEDASHHRRFRTERQILASLDHPNISRLLDGGTTAENRPYLVMEYIAGVPLLEFCDQRRLNVRERVQLFRAICAPVQYAHGRLVVHRDLKPSNILITDAGVPKLLDFGIAKLLEPASFFQEPQATATFDRFLTPSYASPEQAAGQAVTVASDVYALGVVLYELLCGRRPNVHPGGEVGLLAARDWRLPDPPSFRIKDAEPQGREALAGARGATPRALARRLQGDLDRIVLKALQPRPEYRYESVEALAEDLRRHLDGLPVLARPAHWRYRTGKFLRRNLVPVATAVVVITGSAGFGFANVWKSKRLAQEVARAEQQRQRAEEVTRFLADTFILAKPTATDGKPVTAVEILRSGAARVAEELADQPETQATLMHVLGDIHLHLGLHEEAQALIRGSVIRRRQRLAADDPDLLESLDSLAFVKIELGQLRQAQRLAESVLAQRRAGLGGRPPDKAFAESLTTLGWLYTQQGDPAALPLLRESLGILEGLLGPGDMDTAGARNNLATALASLGRNVEAEAQFRELVTTLRKVLAEENPNRFRALSNWASVLVELERYEEAERLYREALAPARRVYGDKPLTARILDGVGYCLLRQGRLEAAEPFLREALALYRTVHGPTHPDVAASELELAELLTAQERCAEALPLAEAAYAVRSQVYGVDHWRTAVAAGVGAPCQARTGDLAVTERRLLDGYRTLSARPDVPARHRRDYLARLERFFANQGRHEEAARFRAQLEAR